jgi:hypothetical protein
MPGLISENRNALSRDGLVMKTFGTIGLILLALSTSSDGSKVFFVAASSDGFLSARREHGAVPQSDRLSRNVSFCLPDYTTSHSSS